MEKTILALLIGAFLIGLPFAAAYGLTATNIISARPTSNNVAVIPSADSVAVKETKDASVGREISVSRKSENTFSVRNVRNSNVVRSTEARAVATKEDATRTGTGAVEVSENEKVQVNDVDSKVHETFIETSESEDVSSYLNDSNWTGEQNDTNITWQKICKGDVNMDGYINGADIDPFVSLIGMGLQNNVYAADMKWKIWVADFNGDWAITFDDIDPFVEVLVSDVEPVCVKARV